MRLKGFHWFTFVLAIAASVLVAQVVTADVLLSEDFETDGSGGARYTLTEDCNDNGGDFFTRTDGSDLGSWVQYTGPNNSFFFAGMDTDGAPCTMTSESILFNAAATTNYGTLMVYGLFAEDDDGTNQDWDADSQVILEASLDGGAYAPLICFASQGATNTEPGLDADCDGVRDGAALTPTFTEYSAPIVGLPNTVQLRIRVENMDAGDEDIAFDLIRLEGVVVPVELQSFQID